MKNEQQMLAEAYQGIEPSRLSEHEVNMLAERPPTAYDLMRIENDYWASKKEAIDEIARATRKLGRKVPHEI